MCAILCRKITNFVRIFKLTMNKALLSLLLFALSFSAYGKHFEAKISTSMGDITVRLYNDTPLHRDNFVKLAREGFYDSLLFHRVIAGFMVQAGDPDSKNAPADAHLGEGDVDYTIPNEIIPNNYHKMGVLAAARLPNEMNPTRSSSGCQFYITVVPTPHLNGQYTVYGQVVDGMKVVEKIAKVPTNKESRPKKEVRIKTIEIYERED